MFHELVYTSIAHPHAMQSAELERILVGARKNNSAQGITGLLIYGRGEFVQLLEGPREAVQQVFNEIISRDQRHGGVSLVWEQAVAQRSFAEWWMGFAHAGGLDAPVSPGLEGYLQHGIGGLDLSGPGSTGRKLLLNIYEQLRASR